MCLLSDMVPVKLGSLLPTNKIILLLYTVILKQYLNSVMWQLIDDCKDVVSCAIK